MGDWSGAMVRVDAWLLLGAVVQCVLVLRARRFQLPDWFLPLLILIGGSAFWFGFIIICSTVPDAANSFIIGFFMAMIVSGAYISGTAPPRLKAAALLSFTVTFWAIYMNGGLSRSWLYPAVVMTAASLWFASFPRATPLIARMALQTWCLSVATAAAADGVPSNVSKVLQDYRVEELAHTLPPIEVLITGAQFFLFSLLGAGVVMLVIPETWEAWYPSRRDERPRLAALAAVMVQGAVLIWARGHGAEVQGQLVSLSVLAALAHGAMSGGEEDDEGPLVLDNSELTVRVDPKDKERIRDFLRGFIDSFWPGQRP
ncbi:MAG: hypothetical protein ACHQ51_09855 [Elusimicrobiota bacterium]